MISARSEPEQEESSVSEALAGHCAGFDDAQLDVFALQNIL